jgi:hypothetical protein
MKTKIVLLVISAFVGAALFGLGGCAAAEKANTESLLGAAGFRVRTPETPKQKEIYAQLEDEKLQRATVNGKVFYLYKDEDNGTALVGREEEYQRFRELSIQQRIAQDYYMAAEMDRMYAHRWYGAWGYRGIWW